MTSLHLLVTSFDGVVFDYPGKTIRGYQTVPKWASPIRFRIAGDPAPLLRQQINRAIAQLVRLTGIPWIEGRFPSPEDNLVIYLVPASEIPATKRRHFGPEREITAHDKWGGCSVNYALREIGFPIQSRGNAILIATDKGVYTTGCVVEELTHILGASKDRATYRPSRLPSGFPRTIDLTINDKILIRALYDPRLTPGIPRSRALPVVREILAELREAVIAHGERALDHPDWLKSQRLGATGG